MAELLDGFSRELPEEPTLLDVGGYPGTFVREFTVDRPEWKATTLDRPDEELTNYVSGSGERLPFDDNTVDVVISIDTLEHVPREGRGNFVNELTRVSKSLVILAAPFHHNATANVERLLDRAHRDLFGEAHPWLGEHVEHGLPSLERTVAHWPKSFPVVDVRRSYELGAWVTWQAMSLARKVRGELDPVWERYDSVYAETTTPPINSVPYRYVVIAQKGSDNRPVEEVMMPSPDAGKDVIALARLFCRMLELTGPDGQGTGTEFTLNAIDARLKEALAAAEQEVGRLRVELAQSHKPSSPFSKLRKKFGG